MKLEGIRAVFCVVFGLLITVSIHAGKGKAFAQPDQVEREYQQIEAFLRASPGAPSDLSQQCQQGQHNGLQTLNQLRQDDPELMRNWRYGPVKFTTLQGNHHGLVLYRDPGSNDFDAHLRAMQDPVRVIHYSNGYSRIFGGYQYSKSDFFRRNRGRPDDTFGSSPDDFKKYFNAAQYPDPEPLDLSQGIPRPPVAVEVCLVPKRTKTRGVVKVDRIDPNDKVGSQGDAELRYLSGEEPLRYTILFENLAEATAPAEEVIVTDQLDVNKMDLSTLSLGPISFGDKQIVPSPGLSEFTTDVDLRPDKNLIVRIDARLDPNTGSVTWRFISIDPATGQLTEDPLGGFLPPNRNPPEGEGSVLFTVMPKKGLPTGTEIRNQARIVFGLNPPVDTPEWFNTLDNTKPISQVDSVGGSSGLEVWWSGGDEGSGILDYTIFASEDGGPFKPWLANISETSGTFIGTCGKNYRFYSVARDATGNVEDAPTATDAVATIANCDLAVAKITAPKTVTLTTKNPSRTERVRVEIQNRSPHNEMIPDMATLGNLVSLTVESLGSCVAPSSVLHSGKPQKTLPLTLKPKQKLGVVFDLTFSCANDPAKSTKDSPGHEDYRFSARVNHAALGSLDAHPDDDVCPRSVTPPGVIDPIFGGKLLDKGCGAKKADGTFGGDVKTDVIVKP